MKEWRLILATNIGFIADFKQYFALLCLYSFVENCLSNLNIQTLQDQCLSWRVKEETHYL